MIAQVIAMIIVGGIVGALARLFLKGNQQSSALWTVVLGAGGAAIGAWLAGLFGVASTAGIDWIRWIFSVIAAMILINIFIAVKRK